MSDRPNPTPALSETFSAPPEPTDADVDRLAAAWYGANWNPATEGPGGIVTRVQRESARQAIERGVTLPPEPEPPQERYYVDKVGARYWLFDRWNGTTVAGEFASSALAERVAALLNADERCKDAHGVNLIARADAAAEFSRSVDALAARVEELEGELAEHKAVGVELNQMRAEAERKLAGWAARQAESQAAVTSWRTRAQEAEAKVRLLEEEVADTRQALATQDKARQLMENLLRDVALCGADDIDPRMKYVEVQVDRATWAELAQFREEPDLVGGIAACEVCGAGGCDEVHEADDAQPAEPLFTGESLVNAAMEANVYGVKMAEWTSAEMEAVLAWVNESAASRRPAPRAITPEDVREAFRRSGIEAVTTGRLRTEVMADVLNARLAGNNPEGEIHTSSCDQGPNHPGPCHPEDDEEISEPDDGVRWLGRGQATLSEIMGALAPYTDDVALRILAAAKARVENLTSENLGEEGV